MSDESFLRAARERKDVTQADMAVKFGVTQATISHWETGEASPHPKHWKRIAEEYGVGLLALTRFFAEAKAS